MTNKLLQENQSMSDKAKGKAHTRAPMDTMSDTKESPEQAKDFQESRNRRTPPGYANHPAATPPPGRQSLLISIPKGNIPIYLPFVHQLIEDRNATRNISIPSPSHKVSSHGSRSIKGW